MTTYPQIQYYRAVVLKKVAEYENMTDAETHEKLKREYFGGSTRIWTPMEFEDILKMIREDYSKKHVWIPEPNGDNLPPYQQE